MNTEAEETKPPKTVTYAIYLLIATVVLWFVNAFIDKYVMDSELFTSTGVMVWNIILYLLIIVFIFFISKGSKTARIVFVVLLSLTIKTDVVIILSLIYTSTIEGILTFLQSAVKLAAIILLFLPESNKWFNMKR